MSKQFWIFLLAGLGVVGAGIFFLLVGTKSAHVDLEGKVLKVRILSLGQRASFVVVDFRVTNPSDVPFVVQTAAIEVEPRTGEKITGMLSSKSQIDQVFQSLKLVGPKYNDMLGMRDKIDPHKTVDRMVAARVELSEAQIDSRRSLRIRVEEVDGAVAELVETR
jgi:hypothetical protein